MPKHRFCEKCGGPGYDRVYQLARRAPTIGPPDTAYLRTVKPVCFYGCSAAQEFRPMRARE